LGQLVEVSIASPDFSTLPKSGVRGQGRELGSGGVRVRGQERGCSEAGSGSETWRASGFKPRISLEKKKLFGVLRATGKQDVLFQSPD